MRNILIFGAAGTLGQKVAEEFAGDNLFLSDIRKPSIISENSTYCECDVTDYLSVKNLRIYFEKANIKIDVIVYATGKYEGGTVTQVDPECWNLAMDVNVNGLYYVLHELIPCMNENGKVIAIASQFGLVGAYESVSYCASKAAMINLIRSVALDYGKNIYANCVCPGFFESPFLHSIEKNTTMKREWMAVLGALPRSKVKIQDIVSVICMLSNNSSITGQCITVDSGYTAR